MEQEAKDKGRIYEIGFLIAPFVTEENLAHEVGKIKDAISNAGGQMISDDFPRLRPLAYAINLHSEGANKKFKEAYFGWIKFEGEPTIALSLKEAIEKNTAVIRHLIIKTVRENTLYGVKLSSKNAEIRRKTDEKPVDAKPINPEELDKTIDSLVV